MVSCTSRTFLSVHKATTGFLPVRLLSSEYTAPGMFNTRPVVYGEIEKHYVTSVPNLTF